MLKLLSKREKLILFITVGVIIISYAYNLAIEPILSRNAVLDKEISSTRARLEKSLYLLNRKDYLHEQHNKYFASQGALETQEGQSLGALSELENLAKSSDIHIVDLRPQSQKNSFELRTEGGIQGYFKFLYNVESSQAMLKIRKFQLTSKPNTSSIEGSFLILQQAASE